jgi:hypothetical protein
MRFVARVRLFMPIQNTRLRKTSIANVTFVGLFSTMRSLMLYQHIGLREFFIAYVTLVGFFARVSSFVEHESFWRCARFLANVTRATLLLVHVRFFMIYQTTQSWKLLIAEITIVTVYLRVRLFVFCQAVVLREFFIAYVAFKRPFARMYPLMYNQSTCF